mgnify:CR=1 FL=1
MRIRVICEAYTMIDSSPAGKIDKIICQMINRGRNMRVFRRGGTTRKVTAILMLAFVITGCSGCESYDNFKDTFFNKNGESDKIRIAVYEPMSGRDSEYAQAEIAGIEMAYSLFPKALDKDVELIYCNNMSDIYACDSVVTNLVQKRPAIVLGSYGSRRPDRKSVV